jgi:PHD/YefM family antitoxin component YafN of YafNO toxin-antitoxin module
MKEVTVKQLAEQATEILDMAQTDRVVILQNGKPSAVVLGLKYKDEEDYALERDAGFWQMIRERRRRNKLIPWEEAKKQLGLGPRKAKKKTTTK